MCGRYVTAEEAAMRSEYRVDSADSQNGEESSQDLFKQSFNVAPSHHVPVVRVVRDLEGRRELVAMRWGLIPHWANGEPPAYSTINATVERLATAPAWHDPWRRGQRCIMPCAGFYEWQLQPDGRKQPYYIKPLNSETFAFAALWDESMTPVGERILSCAVITVPANELLTKIHNTKFRMPAILRPEHIETWLTGSVEEARKVLQPYPSEEMMAWTVSTRVNAPANNGPDLIRPWEPEPLPQQPQLDL